MLKPSFKAPKSNIMVTLIICKYLNIISIGDCGIIYLKADVLSPTGTFVLPTSVCPSVYLFSIVE